ncbi:ATPase [Dactylonectria estremocensis]|uniref:ATPase n=1 Tax=Dactylonectria estremocensis TaxID=1079267 RepID=A0A9P9ILF5_9HYPO|nr:ATPase [Dactylonectria estremocensis]
MAVDVAEGSSGERTAASTVVTTDEIVHAPSSVPIRPDNASAAGSNSVTVSVTQKPVLPDTSKSSSDGKVSAKNLEDNKDGSDKPGGPEVKLVENDKDAEPTDFWKSSAPLYCKRIGRSHAILVDFYIWKCPECGQDLRPSENEDFSDDEDGKPKEKEKDIESSEDPMEDVSYSVEFIDRGKNVIIGQSWEGPFDLSAARKGVRSADRSVFDIVTVLETSLPDNPHRMEHEIERIVQKGILSNPNLTVKVSTTRININSTELIKAIGSLVQYYPANLEGETLELKAPYMLIAHHFEEMEAYLRTHRSLEISEDDSSTGLDDKVLGSVTEKQAYQTVGARHLAILLDYFKSAVYNDIVEEKARHARNACTYGMLWYLYRPGITVYFESDGQLSAYIVNSLESSELVDLIGGRRVKQYVVNLWNLDFDGRFVGRCAKTVTIPQFDGERQINSLKLFPCEFIDREDGGATRQRLEDNGKKWYDLLRGGQVHYSGRLLDSGKRQFEGRVYVDLASYYAQGPDTQPPGICDISDLGEELAMCQCEDCQGYRPHPPTDFPWTRYDLLDPNVEKDLEIPGAVNGPRHRYLLCGRLLHGFDLKSRTWVKVDVACCQTPRMNVKAIDTLVMPADRKEMIKALIHKFTGPGSAATAPGSWRADFLENKGEGQIFLLHGSPGVGKTYTAECIAEYTGRPMLSLTVADIGTDEVKMEKQLVKWFQLAEKWGAVMLIDEADVFLEKRQVTDLKRNSLVSVFLRCIEYYRGVLFLTTNRVGHFDDAFMSRIHVVIYYDKLGIEDRRQIWGQFFDKLSDDREDFIITGRAKSFVLEDDTICQIEWNGREIRNAFQTAVSLAEFRFLQKPNKTKNDNPTLDQKDFEQVCKMVRQFKQYLVDVHGVDEDGRAFMYKARRDSRNAR